MSSTSTHVDEILREIREFKREEKKKRENLEEEISSLKEVVFNEKENKKVYLKKYQDELRKSHVENKELRTIICNMYNTFLSDENEREVMCRTFHIDRFREVVPKTKLFMKRIRTDNETLVKRSEDILSSIKTELRKSETELSYDIYSEDEDDYMEFIYEGVKYMRDTNEKSSVYDEEGDHIGYWINENIHFLNDTRRRNHNDMKEKYKIIL
jgi:hypothetical protein